VPRTGEPRCKQRGHAFSAAADQRRNVNRDMSPAHRHSQSSRACPAKVGTGFAKKDMLEQRGRAG
jgi:hypothetical protein